MHTILFVVPSSCHAPSDAAGPITCSCAASTAESSLCEFALGFGNAGVRSLASADTLCKRGVTKGSISSCGPAC